MKKCLFIFIFLLVTASVTNSQYFSASIGTGLALNLTSNSNQSVFGFNIVHASGQYTFNSLFATRLNFQYYLFPGKTTTDEFGNSISTDAAGIIVIKGDFMIGKFDKTSSVNPYGYIGNGLAIPTGGGGPYYYIDFGGGAFFKIAHDISIMAETGFLIATSSPAAIGIPFRGGVKFDF